MSSPALTAPMSPEEIRSAADKLRWFHQIDLGHGIVTSGNDTSQKKLDAFGLPDDLSGKSVLDIGAWDGFFSFAAERRGAKRVLATDHFCWSGKGWGTKAGFELARRALNSQVEDYEVDVLDLNPEVIGQFDVVLFLGVLYHMRHPLLSLERVSSVTAPGGMVILETHVDMLHLKRPALAFYLDRELNNDPTNWFGPNPAAVEHMLRAVGFQRIVAHTPVPKPKSPDPEVLSPGRMVFHAWK